MGAKCKSGLQCRANRTGGKVGRCGIYITCERQAGMPQAREGRASRSTVPSWGSSSAMLRSNRVFPQPEGPATTMRCPGLTVRVTGLSNPLRATSRNWSIVSNLLARAAVKRGAPEAGSTVFA